MTFTEDFAPPVGVTQKQVDQTRALVREYGCGPEVLAMLGISPAPAATPRRSRQCRLDVDTVREIRRLYAGGLVYQRIADRFGVSVPTVRSVVLRLTWKDVS
jgi:hypothetical protein